MSGTASEEFRRWMVLFRLEWRHLVRSRRLAAGAVVFALLSLGVVFGTAAIGGRLVWRDFSIVSVGLASLTLYVMPLIAVTTAFDAFAAEAEQGTLLLMLSYPMRRTTWGLAKLAAQAAALAVAWLPAMAVLAAVWLFTDQPWRGTEVLTGLMRLFVLGWAYGTAFAVIGVWGSLAAKSRGAALAGLLFFWFAAVFLWDLALLTATVASDGALPRWVLALLMTLNVSDAFRLLTLPAGPGDLSVPPVAAVAAIGGWIAAGTALALNRLRRLTI